jgi:hypothetical protein
MANEVRKIISKISSDRTAKVKEIREIEAQLRPSGISDAERKSLNEERRKLEQERSALEAEGNKLFKLAKTAEEYIKLNKELEKIEADIAKAEAQGRDSSQFKSKRTGAVRRLEEISPDVEREFPSIKVTPVVETSQAAPSGSLTLGADGRPVTQARTSPEQAPATPALTTAGMPVAGTQTVTPTVTPTVITPPKTPKTKTPPKDKETVVDREAQALNVAAGTDFALPETLFKNIPSLNNLLKKYVNTPGMTPDAFRKMLRDDTWYKQNSQEIKSRFVQYYNYRDLQATGQATGSSDYEMQIDKIEAKLRKRAVEIGSAAASDPAALRKAAENLYITNRSEDQSFIDDFLAASIRPVAGMIGGKGTEGYSGQALTNYQELVRTARNNGLQVSDIIPGDSNEQQVLEGIASGKLDINRIIQDTRKLAAQGQPQYVRDLLSQGYNLDQVYAPYRQTMAAVLEIDDTNAIDLNDPLLRSAINDKGDMNIYDFKKSLRRDSRWQYTEQAREDVSRATLNILRDFGFQG